MTKKCKQANSHIWTGFEIVIVVLKALACFSLTVTGFSGSILCRMIITVYISFRNPHKWLRNSLHLPRLRRFNCSYSIRAGSMAVQPKETCLSTGNRPPTNEAGYENNLSRKPSFWLIRLYKIVLYIGLSFKIDMHGQLFILCFTLRMTQWNVLQFNHIFFHIHHLMDVFDV